MKFERLLNQASERIPSYRRVIFKTFVISLASGAGAKTSGIFRRFADILSIAGVSKRKLYNFLNSAKIPWNALVDFLVASIAPHAVRDGRILVALDDTTYGKSGKNVAGCSTHFDHAAKQNSSKWIFGHCRVLAGILTFGHGRWICLPLLQKLYTPLPKNIKDSKKLPHPQWLKTKSGIGATLVVRIAELFQKPVVIVCDSWFGTKPLLDESRKGSSQTVHILSRLRVNSSLFALPKAEPKRRGAPRKYGDKLSPVRDLAASLRGSARTALIHIYGRNRECLFSEIVCMSGALKCQVKIVFVYRKNHVFPLITTDLELSAEEMIEFYSARWKIESGFKELKHEVGAIDSQCRTSLAVENHFDLCCFATSLAWLSALQTEKPPKRLHPTAKSNSFAFADVRRRIASEMECGIFNRGCPESVIPAVKFICSALFRISA